MSEEEKKKARELILAGKYVEAAEMLNAIKNYDADARQFLKTMAEIENESIERPQKVTAIPTYPPVMTRWAINLLVLAIGFIITRSVVPGIVYWLYDWRFNRKEKLETNMVVVGITVSLGLSFVVTLVLTVILGSVR